LTPPAPGQTGWSESVIWTFGGFAGDGVQPLAGLIELGGKLYGTTLYGGTNNLGAVFELTPPAPGETGWSESIIWSFGGFASDGELADAGLIELGGKFYGVTYGGGADCQRTFCGTAFELTPPAPVKLQITRSLQSVWPGAGGVNWKTPPLAPPASQVVP
jgi:uncharacterized repeat protein (TIGR03803 family)